MKQKEDKATIAKLFKIAKDQQKIISKMAQQIAGQEAGGTDAKIKALIAPEFAKLIRELTVKNQNQPGGMIVYYKYISTDKDNELKAHVTLAADQVLGKGNYKLSGIGEF